MRGIKLRGARWSVFTKREKVFDVARQAAQGVRVSETSPSPLLNVLCWLARHASYPQSRLPAPAERLLLLTVAAQVEEAAEKARPSYLIQSSDSAMQSAQRQHAERRRRVHYKCDNSAKV